jgi:hypothetical protein
VPEPPCCEFLLFGLFEFAGISFVKKVLWCRHTERSDDCWYCAHKGIEYSPAPRSARLFLYRAVVPLPLLRLFRLRGCHLPAPRRASDRAFAQIYSEAAPDLMRLATT